MTWVKVSDDFWRHPKVRRLLDRPLGPAALGLWVAAQSWIGEELTDGFVPDRQPTRLMGADVSDLVEELVLVGLWERAIGGWQVHDYLDYNPSRAQVDDDRERRHELAIDGGKARAKTGLRDGDGRFVSSRTAGDESSGTAGVPAGVPAGPSAGPSSRTAGPPAGKSPAVAPAVRPAVEPAPYPVTRSNSVPSTLSTREPSPREPLLTAHQRDQWSSFGPEWNDVKLAWLQRGMRLPPKGSVDTPGSQRAVLFEVLDARPKDLVRWIREARGKRSHEVVAHVLREYHRAINGASS